MLVDTHCHLNLHQFDSDLEKVILRARDVGIERILVPGVDIHTSRRAIELADQYPEVYAAIGIHPNYSNDFKIEMLEELKHMAQYSKVYAIGEIGIDHYRTYSPIDVQLSAFNLQIELASDLDKPIIIHSRDGDVKGQAIQYILKSLRGLKEKRRDITGVFHAFSGDIKVAHEIISLGMILGIGGAITYKSANSLREVVKTIDISGMVPETDSPYITPVPHRGKRNEPAYVKLVIDAISGIKEIPLDDTITITRGNSDRLFNW